MADKMKQIHDFALKWCDKFRNQNIKYTELVDHWMADECDALGFEMDCGHSFSDKYGNAFQDCDTLNDIIDDVTDISLLGSAIYSRWRYFNHWAYDASTILEPQNRAWFILALSRLAFLSGDNPFIFQGTLKKIRIISNNSSYGTMPKEDDEVEQHLTINDNGQVWFSGYHYGNDEKARTMHFKIEKTSADDLMHAFASYFSREYDEVFVTDIGNWEMELTNTEGKVYKFRGSLCSDFDYDGIDLSDLVRETVGMDDLYVFDGNTKPDVINRITIDYHRVTKIEPPEELEIDKILIWDYTEHLIIDRETQTLEHIQNIGQGCKVSHKYEVSGDIDSLLDAFVDKDLFSNVKNNSEYINDDSDETIDYKITINSKKKSERIIEGSFDKDGLPDDFPIFADIVFDFIRFYGLGEILNPKFYGNQKNKPPYYIFCSVAFDEGYKNYYYLSDDESIQIGDFVIVPAGKDNHEEVVQVVNIEYFSEENAPFPIEKTKKIIRKYTDKDSQYRS